MLAVLEGISSAELFSFAVAFLGMLIGGTTQAVLARAAQQRNTARLNDMDSETMPAIEKRLRKLETWRSERRGAEMERQGKSPDLAETSTTRQFGRRKSEY